MDRSQRSEQTQAGLQAKIDPQPAPAPGVENLSRLLEAERQARQVAERRALRLERLQEVTATLTTPLSPAQVAQVVVEQGIAALEAGGGLVALLDDTGQYLEVMHAFGYPPEVLEKWQRFPLDLVSPLTDAVHTGEVVLLAPDPKNAADYAHLRKDFNPGVSYAAIPLEVEGRSFGALGLTFNPGHHMDQADHNFILALARQCAQALERARLEEAEQVARRQTEINQLRLAFLAEASEILNASLDYQTTLHNLAHLLVPRQADWCSVDMLAEDGRLERLAVAHVDPTRVAWAHELHRRYPPDMNAQSGVARAIRTGQPEIYPVITEEMLTQAAEDAEQLSILRQVGFSSLMIVPMMSLGRSLGAITFVWAESGYHYGDSELNFAVDLAHRAAMAVENSRLYREAQEAVQVQKELDYYKNLFLSTATHELRTPLTSVKGYAQLLDRAFKKLRDSDTPPDPQVFREDLDRHIRSVEMVVWQVERMNRLIAELLDFSRLDNDKFVLDRANQLNLADVINRVVEQMTAIGDTQPVILDLPKAPVLGYWDESRLEQVLINLLGNAFKYSPKDHPVTVGLELRRSPASNRPEALVWVQDNGIGIDQEHQANIFERFYRVRNGNTARIDGLGLGLYISHEIVTRHDGRMWLESQPGLGSTFYFTLPLESSQ